MTTTSDAEAKATGKEEQLDGAKKHQGLEIHRKKRQNRGTKEPGTQEESAKVEDFLVTAVHLLANFLSSSAFEGRKQLW